MSCEDEALHSRFERSVGRAHELRAGRSELQRRVRPGSTNGVAGHSGAVVRWATTRLPGSQQARGASDRLVGVPPGGWWRPAFGPDTARACSYIFLVSKDFHEVTVMHAADKGSDT